MNTIFPQRLTGGLMVLFFFMTSLGFSQGTETFTNIGPNASNYVTRSWIGDNGESWGATKARTDQTINGKAITFSDVNGATLTTTIPGGIGNLTITSQRKFGGTSGTISVSINGTTIASTFPYGTTVQTTTISGIDASGSVNLILKTDGNNRVAIDDVVWTAFPTGNVGPSITNILQTPSATQVEPDDAVLVSADIIDSDGVASAQLNWGLTSGSLTNAITMSLDTGNSYSTNRAIPAQPDGTTVYYHIVATDSNASPETTTSAAQSYTSVNPKPVISNIELVPAANEIQSDDSVLVSADITDADGIASAQLNWGLTSGSLNNTITMSLDTGMSYSTDSAIPALGNGTVVYYSITATDTRSGANTTLEQSYTVQDPAPTISEIVQNPSASSVTNSDTVSVTADITDADQVASAELQWGTTSGNYTNTIAMTLVSGDTYQTSTNIPAQVAGTTIFYVIKATNTFPTTTTSMEFSYTVLNPVPQITNIVQVPDSSSVASTDVVEVSADVIDNDPISSVQLRWGTTSGTLPNVITMNLVSGDTYTTATDIPAMPNGTTVYYQIEATDDNPFPATTTSAERSYTVEDPLVFAIPYENALRDQNNVDDAETVGFTFTGTDLRTSAGGYIKIDLGGTIESPAIDFSTLNDLTVAFSMRTFGGNTGQELTVYVSNDDGATYDLVSIHAATDAYIMYEDTIDLTTLNSTTGRIKFEMTAGTNSIRFRDLFIYDGYIYFDGVWRPSDPADLDSPTTNLYVKNGTATLNNTSVNNITVDAGATLEIKRVLNVAGSVMNNGEMVFLSTATRTGELGPVDENETFGGNGIVTFHRYMSNNRAYRMVSSSVNTTTSIHDNWQEGALSNSDNPSPGFGTHITGTTVDQQNGFDATATGNSSMFTVDIANQAFVPVSNTDVNTLEAGKPYLLYVRGDRSIDLTSNNSSGETILRASGELAHGINIQSFNTTTAGQFVMFGNPYQSGVDMNSVFGNSININPNTYFVYDPTLADAGAYVSVDLATGTNAVGSEANEFLQVGQGAQVATLNTGNSSVVFHQADKAPGNYTRTSATENGLSSDNMLTVQLYTTERYNNGGSVHDGFAMIFDANNSNELTPLDAVKPMNFYENLGIDHNGTYLSIERRAMPEQAEVYPLYSTGYQYSDYTFKLTVDGLDNSILYLEDYFNGTSTLLETGDNSYGFSIDNNDPLSKASDRFAIRAEANLGVNDTNILSGIRLFPNPLKDDTFYINAPKLNGEQLDVRISDLSGRIISEQTLDCRANTVTVPMNNGMSSGIYLVTLTHGGEASTYRLIKQ